MKTTKQLVKFDFDLAVITALDAKYKDIQITDGKSYAVVMQGLAEYRELRLRIDTLHKNYKKDILEAGRGLDADKNRLKGLLEPGENHLKEIRQIEDDKKAKIKEEKEQKERERIEKIQEKVRSVVAQGIIYDTMPSSTIKERLIILKGHKVTKEIYAEFTNQTIQAQKEAVAGLERMLAYRIQSEKEALERKAEAKHLEKVRKEQEAAQAKIDEGARKVREGIAKLEVDRKAAEETKEREEFERQATIKAEQEAKEKGAREEQEKIDKEKAEAKEKARQEALRPDKEKLIKFAEEIIDIGVVLPVVKSKEAQKILSEANDRLYEVADDITKQADKL